MDEDYIIDDFEMVQKELKLKPKDDKETEEEQKEKAP